MDLLIVDALEPEILQWISARHPTRYAPELDRDPRALRQALYNVRALVVPGSVALDAQALNFAPVLRAIGRLNGGVESLDTDACARAGIEVVRAHNSTALAEAEFAVGTMLQLLRRVPVRSADGFLVGRELGAATVGLVGMTVAARPLANLLAAFGTRVVGYDPSIHANDGLWSRWNVSPLSLREVIEQADVMCVLMPYFARYKGLLGERFLNDCRANQIVVNLSHSDLFDEGALALALNAGRISAAWFDSMEPGAQDPGRPLHHVRGLQVSPRVAGTTRESRVRSAWAVIRRIDELLTEADHPTDFAATVSDAPVDFGVVPGSV